MAGTCLVSYAPLRPHERREAFAEEMDKQCTNLAQQGYRLVTAVGNYGVTEGMVKEPETLGIWLFFERNG